MNRNRPAKRSTKSRSTKASTRSTSAKTTSSVSTLSSVAARSISTRTSASPVSTFSSGTSVASSQRMARSSTVTTVSRRGIAGGFELPSFVGEPAVHYEQGSKSRADLVRELKRVRSEVVEVPCVVGGKEIFTGNTIEQVMPSDHKHVIARVHLADKNLVQEAIGVAKEAQHEWASLPQHHRAMVFRRAADLISTKHRARMNAVTMLGTGKTVWQAEIDSAMEQADFLRLNGNFAQDLAKDQPPLNSPGVWNRVRYRPLEGFVAAISPFNFCAIGANLNAAPALMGNVTLWKPARTAVLENYVSYQIFKEAGLPDGVVNFLPSDHDSFGSALRHRDLAGLHFTGSSAVFQKLWSDVGNNISNYRAYPRIVGETGGKNFHVIHPSADLTHSVLNTVRAAFEYQGQKCSAASRAYVPQSLWDNGFKDMLVEQIKTIKMGQPDDLGNFMSAVIDSRATDKHSRYINEAKNGEDTSILIGGNVDTSQGFFVEPTVIVTKNPKSPTMTDELFGPILTVFVYDDSKPKFWSDVTKLVDETSEYGLTGAIFANDRLALVEAEKNLINACGNMYLNDKSTGAVVGEQPFGGARASGTNDKAGSPLNLLRWVSAQSVKENSHLITGYEYPHMM